MSSTDLMRFTLFTASYGYFARTEPHRFMSYFDAMRFTLFTTSYVFVYHSCLRIRLGGADDKLSTNENFWGKLFLYRQLRTTAGQ